MSTGKNARRAASSGSYPIPHRRTVRHRRTSQLFVEPPQVDFDDVQLVHPVPPDRPAPRFDRIARAKTVPAAWENTRARHVQFDTAASSADLCRGAPSDLEPPTGEVQQLEQERLTFRDRRQSSWPCHAWLRPTLRRPEPGLSRGIRPHAPPSPRRARGRFAEGRAPTRAREVALGGGRTPNVRPRRDSPASRTRLSSFSGLSAARPAPRLPRRRRCWRPSTRPACREGRCRERDATPSRARS